MANMTPEDLTKVNFEPDHRMIDEIDNALPKLAAERAALLDRQPKLKELLAEANQRARNASDQRGRSNIGGNSDSAQRLSEIVAELQTVTAKHGPVEIEFRGKLLSVKQYEDTYRTFSKEHKWETLTKWQQERLGLLRMKMRRILTQYGYD